MAQHNKPMVNVTAEPTSTQHGNVSSTQLAPNVFDTPKTLSPAISRDGSLLTPSRPVETYTPSGKPLMQVDTARDVEKGALTPLGSERYGQPSPLYSPCRQYSFTARVKECTMWPSRQTLEAKAHKEKSTRRAKNYYGLSSRWGSLTKMQRLLVWIIIALVIIGCGVGLGVGISQAVGGSVYTGKNSSTTIPKTD